MNSEEGMSMAKMAVTALLVVLLVGAVITIAYAAYNWFTSGTDKLSDQVTSIDKSRFSQYDNAVVTGTEVLSALSSFRDADMCIFIQNVSTGGYNATPPGDATVPVFCAVPSDVSTGSGGASGGTGTSSTPMAKVSYADGKFTFNGFKYTDASNVSVVRNTNFSPTTTPGATSTYVKQSAKWYANLVYDKTTDEIAGLIFRQMK